MSLELVTGILAVLGAAALLAILACALLALRGRGPIGAAVQRRHRARRASVVDLARAQGWTLGDCGAVSGRGFDPQLRAERAAPLRCDLVVHGEDFTSESWTVRVHGARSPVRQDARQQVLRLPCPGLPHFLVRSVPTRHELRYFPVGFKEQAGFTQLHTQLLVGGEIAAVVDRLIPFAEAIQASRVWVVGLSDELVLSSSTEPDAARFEQHLALGRALAAALA